jgi:DNA-binding LacI/PurR family transcriptional regulator
VPRVTLQTLADKVGVSRMTVSNAFSRPDQLSAELRERILAVAGELGYTGPDPAARALARGSIGAVGVMLTDSLEYAFTDEVATRMLAAISVDLTATGLGLTLLTSTAGDGFVPARDIPLDGALVYSCHGETEAMRWLEQRGLPLVFVDNHPRPGRPSINVDEVGGAHAAAEHIVSLRHRRVALVTALDRMDAGVLDLDVARSTPDYTISQRMAGWVSALEPAGIEPIVVNAPRSTEVAGAAAASVLFALPERRRPTAVIAYSDRIAAGVVFEAQRRGIDVPGDLSVVGFDDAPFAAGMNPALTTVHQDIAEKGHRAASMLIDAIAAKGANAKKPARVVLPTSLVIRQSTARRR